MRTQKIIGQLSAKKKLHVHTTHNIRSSSRRETIFSANPVFSTVDSGHMNSFTAAKFHKLFLTISRVKQTGDFPMYFLAMPQFFWEESQDCELTTCCCSCSQSCTSPKRLLTITT